MGKVERGRREIQISAREEARVTSPSLPPPPPQSAISLRPLSPFTKRSVNIFFVRHFLFYRASSSSSSSSFAGLAQTETLLERTELSTAIALGPSPTSSPPFFLAIIIVRSSLRRRPPFLEQGGIVVDDTVPAEEEGRTDGGGEKRSYSFPRRFSFPLAPFHLLTVL